MDVLVSGVVLLHVGHTVDERTFIQFPEAEEHLQLSGTEQKLLRMVVVLLP